MKKTKGITLISLVVTIIILIILAGVAINLTIRENGIFNKAEYAKDKYLNEQSLEEQQLNELYAYLSGEDLPENTKDTDAGTIVKLPNEWATITPNYISTVDGTMVTESTKVAYVYAVSVGEGNVVPVPIGFWYVGGNMDTGVVISDDESDKYDGKIDKTTWEYTTSLKGNQFVWIPCSIKEYKKCNVWNGITQTGTTLQKSNWDTTVDLAGKIQVEKYNGFYVGRYEAGLAKTIDECKTTQKSGDTQIYNVNGIPQARAGQIPWYHIDWNHARSNAENMYSNDNNKKCVKSGLITGTQWDVMLNKMLEKNNLEASDLTSSVDWGNYVNTQINYKGRIGKIYYSSGWYIQPFGGITEGKTAIYETANTYADLLSTGASSEMGIYNIYDVAGNLQEWTDETSMHSTSDQYRVLRGGSALVKYDKEPSCYRRTEYNVDSLALVNGFRVVLYIK